MTLTTFINKTFKDLKFTIYHITSLVLAVSILLFYVIFYSIEPSFILNKNKYYLKHSDFNYSDENGKEFKTKPTRSLIVNSDGKLRILLFSFLFSVALTFITHVFSITITF